MHYLQFSSDLPPHHTDLFASPEENEETVRRLGVSQQVRQLGQGEFRGKLAVCSTSQADFMADRYSTASSFHLEMPPETVCILLPRSEGGSVHAVGLELSMGDLVVLPARSGISILAPNLSGSDAITLPQSRFEELIATLRPDSRPPDDVTVLRGDRRVLDWIRSSILETIADQKCMRDPHTVSDFLSTVIGFVDECLSLPRLERLPKTRPRRRVARTAREYIEEYYREQIRMEDLCHVTGVSARSLQRHFHQYFGMTITEYLKSVRFEATRRALTASHSSVCTVTSVALDHGFSHLGRFSVDFKQRFGMSPSRLLAERQ